jgi:hypothetical protein
VELTHQRQLMITFKNETFKKNSKNLNFWSLFPILATIYEVKITF